MIDEKISSVNDLLNILQVIKRKYGHIHEFGGPGYIDEETEFCFRGVKDKTYKLCPKVFCEDLYAVQFENYDEPLQRFQREASSYLRNVCGNDKLLWMQYAQHFGVPTRLLDFSSNPLVALYFACHASDEDGAIWIINTDNYTRVSVRDFMKKRNLQTFHSEDLYKEILDATERAHYYPAYFFPEYIDVRLNAQASRFMIWPNEPVDVERITRKNHMMDLSSAEYNAAEDNERYFFMISVDKCKKPDILKELDLLGINEKTLFPGLDSIGKYLDYMFKTENRGKQHE